MSESPAEKLRNEAAQEIRAIVDKYRSKFAMMGADVPMCANNISSILMSLIMREQCVVALVHTANRDMTYQEFVTRLMELTGGMGNLFGRHTVAIASEYRDAATFQKELLNIRAIAEIQANHDYQREKKNEPR